MSYHVADRKGRETTANDYACQFMLCSKQSLFVVPVNPISDHVVSLCALSAQTLPTLTAWSNPDSWPAKARDRAARSLVLFCSEVSFDGTASPMGRKDVAEDGFAAAYGPVAVKRVASVADRGMLD